MTGRAELDDGTRAGEWVSVCPVDRVPPGAGVAALVAGHQVAVFRADDGALYALDNRDPLRDANVLARGIVGAQGDTPTVASPLRKERYDLRTGACLDTPGVRVGVHEVRERAGRIEIRRVALPSSDITASGPTPGTQERTIA